MMRRGQTLSTDMLAAFAIFIFISDASILLWQSQVTRAQQVGSRNWIEGAARSASSQLLSPGEPSNWEIADFTKTPLHSFGLTSSNNVIEWGKMSRAIDLTSSPANYQMVKQNLGLECCEMWFGIVYSNGTVVGSFGRQVPENISIVTIDRKAMLNSSPVTARLRVWQ